MSLINCRYRIFQGLRVTFTDGISIYGVMIIWIKVMIPGLLITIEGGWRGRVRVLM